MMESNFCRKISQYLALCEDHNFMIGRKGMVDSFNVSLSESFIRKKLMKLALSETLKLSTIPLNFLPIMSLFNQFSTGS